MLRLLSILGHAAIGLHDSALNLTEVAWMPETLGVYIGGPSLSVLPWDPAQIIVSSNVFGPSVDFAHTTQNASIHRSTDYGASFAAAGTTTATARCSPLAAPSTSWARSATATSCSCPAAQTA